MDHSFSWSPWAGAGEERYKSPGGTDPVTPLGLGDRGTAGIVGTEPCVLPPANNWAKTALWDQSGSRREVQNINLSTLSFFFSFSVTFEGFFFLSKAPNIFRLNFEFQSLPGSTEKLFIGESLGTYTPNLWSLGSWQKYWEISSQRLMYLKVFLRLTFV